VREFCFSASDTSTVRMLCWLAHASIGRSVSNHTLNWEEGVPLNSSAVPVYQQPLPQTWFDSLLDGNPGRVGVS